MMVTFDPPQNIGGIEGRVRGYVTELRRSGDEVVILALLPGAPLSAGSYLGAPFYTCPSNPAALTRAILFAERIVRRHSIRAVFFLSGGATAFGVAYLALCRLARRRSAVLFYGKDILGARTHLPSRGVLLASQMLSNVIFANSKYTSSLLTSLGKKKSEILYPTISPDFGAGVTVAGLGGEEATILFVGRLVKRKGADDLVNALKELRPYYPDLRLEIVGDGPERSSLDDLVKRLGLSDRVTFFGSLAGKPLLERYQRCTVFAMPSRATPTDAEGFGTVFLEAAWFAKPSLGTDSGGIPEAVVDGSTGILVKDGDFRQLVEGLRRLLDDKSLRSTLGTNARDRVLADFTWQKAGMTLRSCLSGS